MLTHPSLTLSSALTHTPALHVHYLCSHCLYIACVCVCVSVCMCVCVCVWVGESVVERKAHRDSGSVCICVLVGFCACVCEFQYVCIARLSGLHNNPHMHAREGKGSETHTLTQSHTHRKLVIRKEREREGERERERLPGWVYGDFI